MATEAQELFFDVVLADDTMADADKIHWLHATCADYWTKLETATEAQRDLAELRAWAGKQTNERMAEGYAATQKAHAQQDRIEALEAERDALRAERDRLMGALEVLVRASEGLSKMWREVYVRAES